MKFGLDERLLDTITDVMSRFPEVEKAVIFGSRANGTYNNRSDIDIAVYAPTMDSGAFARMSFEIQELPIIFKIDVVLFDTLSNRDLATKIAAEGKEIYSKQAG